MHQHVPRKKLPGMRRVCSQSNGASVPHAKDSIESDRQLQTCTRNSSHPVAQNKATILAIYFHRKNSKMEHQCLIQSTPQGIKQKIKCTLRMHLILLVSTSLMQCLLWIANFHHP